MTRINSYDIDGVINMGEYVGLKPQPLDIIITGRSFEEKLHTDQWLYSIAIFNTVFYNETPFKDKSRADSGTHKARTLNKLIDQGLDIGIHFEDDLIQAQIVEDLCPRVQVVRIVHDLVEKENVWHGPIDNDPSGQPD